MLRSLILELRLWILLGMLCGPRSGWSETSPIRAELPKLDDRDALEFALLDRPKQLVPELRHWLADRRVIERSIEWMRVIWLLAQQDEMDEPGTIQNAAQVA